jgi:two-component system KDP operon response regulator KdpE
MPFDPRRKAIVAWQYPKNKDSISSARELRLAILFLFLHFGGPARELSDLLYIRAKFAPVAGPIPSHHDLNGAARLAMSQARTVLIIDDEIQMRRTLGAALRGQSYEVIEAATGTDGLLKIASRTPRIVLLDLGLPDMDGIEVARRIREQSDVPIIVISVRGDEKNQVLALDSGANDYITKPVREGAFLARVRAVLRSTDPSRRESAAFVVGGLRIDPAQKRAWVRGVEVALTPTEFRLLNVLMQEAGRVVTHQQLLRQVWGPTHAREIQYLRVYMKQLREKIEREPARPEFLVTSPGVGYRLKVTD